MVLRWNLEGHHTQWSRNRKLNHLHKFFAYDQLDMIRYGRDELDTEELDDELEIRD